MSELLAPPIERKLWYEGPNYAADAVILDLKAEQILLVQRQDTGEWALPGGFEDPTDWSSLGTAVREAKEEANVSNLIGGDLVYRGKTSDRRSDATAWVETSAHLFYLPTTAEVQAGDDASGVSWHTLDNLPALYGAHEMITRRALDYRTSRKFFDGILEHSDTKLPVSGGYMKYDKYIASMGTKHAFVKWLPNVGVVSPDRHKQMRSYLEKEAGIMAHLRTHGFLQVPTHSVLRNSQLAMDALRQEDGWQWEASAATLDSYVKDAFDSFKSLESIPLPPDTFDVEPSYESVINEGWTLVDDQAETQLSSFLAALPEGRLDYAASFLHDIPSLRQAAGTFESHDTFVFCHLDMRQENMAWNPEKGIKIIDWSWAGPGLPGSDATSLLIDLHKNGFDVSRYVGHINLQHCYNLMGFWLAHSTMPNQGAEGLREQQFESALSAYELLVAAGARPT